MKYPKRSQTAPAWSLQIVAGSATPVAAGLTEAGYSWVSGKTPEFATIASTTKSPGWVADTHRRLLMQMRSSFRHPCVVLASGRNGPRVSGGTAVPTPLPGLQVLRPLRGYTSAILSRTGTQNEAENVQTPVGWQSTESEIKI